MAEDRKKYIDILWRKLKKPGLTYLELTHLYNWFYDSALALGMDPEALDFEGYLDPSLSYDESKIELAKSFGWPVEEPLAPEEEVSLPNLLAGMDISLPDEDDPNYPAMLDHALRELADRLMTAEKEAVEARRVEVTIRDKRGRPKKVRMRTSKLLDMLQDLHIKIQDLTGELEAEKIQAERLKREAAEVVRIPYVTVRFLENYPSFEAFDEKTYGPFMKGAITSLPESDSATLIERGHAEVWAKPVRAPPAPPPRPPPVRREELTKSERKRLQDFFNTILYDELGRIPRSTSAKFRVEVEKVKNLSYEEAKTRIEGVARDIVGREVAAAKIPPPGPPPPPKIRPYRPPREEEEIPYALARAPPAHPPDKPLNGPEERPFPRSMTRKEEGYDGLRHGFWPSFRYRLQEQGLNPLEYQKLWKQYMFDTVFPSWEELLRRYEFFVDSIKHDKPLPPLWQWKGAPIPYGLEGLVRKEPAGRRADLIMWATSITISNFRREGKTAKLADVRKQLDDSGIAGVTFDEIKTALMEGYQQKEEEIKYQVWFTGITLEELNQLLET